MAMLRKGTLGVGIEPIKYLSLFESLVWKPTFASLLQPTPHNKVNGRPRMNVNWLNLQLVQLFLQRSYTTQHGKTWIVQREPLHLAGIVVSLYHSFVKVNGDTVMYMHTSFWP